jgi:NAD(P)-dependent dehydrogenase (short-subunit alcohol dehydrogenase family)
MFSTLFRLDGKKALVTGGAQGLGRMIAEGLLSAGAEVTITSRKAELCERAADELSLLGRCQAIAADLSSAEAAEALAKRYRDTAKGLDILVNNAGKTWGAPLDTFPDKAWPAIMAINVQIPFKLTQLFLPELALRRPVSDPGRIINIGSCAGARAEPLEAYSYTASKAAIHMLSRQLAADLAPRRINVNAILPGYFPTSMTAHLRDGDGQVDPVMLDHIPQRRIGTPEDIAGAVIFLASRAGAYVTGANLAIDGGIIGCN